MSAARRRAAIFAAKVAGYSYLMGEDETGTALWRCVSRWGRELLKASVDTPALVQTSIYQGPCYRSLDHCRPRETFAFRGSISCGV
jgi:hypothetical protein